MNFPSAFESQKAWSGRAGARNQIRKEQFRAPKHLKREHVWACEEEYLRESQTSKKFWKRLDASSLRIVLSKSCTDLYPFSTSSSLSSSPTSPSPSPSRSSSLSICSSSPSLLPFARHHARLGPSYFFISLVLGPLNSPAASPSIVASPMCLRTWSHLPERFVGLKQKAKL